jgi:hypothetical protein
VVEWAPIKEFPRYSVSDSGLIRNDETERILRQSTTYDGRKKVGLMGGGVQATRIVSRLVMVPFVPNVDPLRSNTPIHLDGDLGNCAAYNLAWRPRWFAKVHTRQFRLGRPVTGPIVNLDTGETYSGVWELVKKYGLLRVDVIHGLGRDQPIYPLMQRFDWLE